MIDVYYDYFYSSKFWSLLDMRCIVALVFIWLTLLILCGYSDSPSVFGKSLLVEAYISTVPSRTIESPKKFMYIRTEGNFEETDLFYCFAVEILSRMNVISWRTSETYMTGTMFYTYNSWVQKWDSQQSDFDTGLTLTIYNNAH